ncbi:MAG TPA: adenylyltransferase/cytidyltransferase family protein [Candidatus Acidoferrum sp.]|jgi:rfaE bifunctional protein nucleotidyltransferase chain/domain
MRVAESKILPIDKLRVCVSDAKTKGKRVVFANGCFDTLHVGHARYLQGAKAQGDILIVGVNSDDSVRRLKGTGRPILDEQARAQLVAALRSVDYVILFSDPNVERLLEDLRPDVHAKGTDYSVETVPERAVAQRLGILVAIVGDPKDHSTRALLDSIRKDAHD